MSTNGSAPVRRLTASTSARAREGYRAPAGRAELVLADRASLDGSWRHGGVVVETGDLPATVADVQALLPRQDDATFDRELVRLWTIKEAAFKSHPDNAGLTLADFRIGTQSKVCAVESARGVRMRVFTAEHRDGLEQLGVTPHHRKSFAPIIKILSPD